MMRHPIETPPKPIDPWAFARARRELCLSLPLSATHTLKQWAANGEAKLSATLSGDTDEYQQSHLAGDVAATLRMQCQRCLEPVQLTVAHAFDYVIIRDEALEARVEGAAETFVCPDDELDVAWFLEEEILLAMPMIASHEDCEAPPIPADVTLPSDSERQYPFADLKNLIQTKEH